MVTSPIDWSRAGRVLAAMTATLAAAMVLAGCLDDTTPVVEPSESAITDLPSPTPIDPEGTQDPRPPEDPDPVIVSPGPPIGGERTSFDEFTTSRCVGIGMSDPFDENAVVIGVSVGDAGAFDPDDVCTGNLPHCTGVTIPAGRTGSECAVGVTWNPDSGETEGFVELTVSATCTTDQVYCGDLPAGTRITFSSAIELTAEVSKPGPGEGEEEGSPGEDEDDTGEEDPERGGEDPDDDPDDGEGSDTGDGDSGSDE
jgi:hypothetical protein